MIDEARRNMRRLLKAQLTMAMATGSVGCAGAPSTAGPAARGPLHIIMPLWRVYRCLYCGLYFCEHCAAVHFGKTRAQWLAAGGKPECDVDEATMVNVEGAFRRATAKATREGRL